MTKRKGGLGRGLGAILSDDPAARAEVEEKVSIHEIPVEQIERNPYQPRVEFDQEALEELAASITAQGIIQPLTVRKLSDNAYQLIAGERRLRASKLAKLKSVPAYVRTANDEQMLEMALIENIQREDLNPIEVALSYMRMMTELEIKQDDLADKVGKKRPTVNNYLRLLKLPPELQDGLRKKEFSFGHARALITVDDPVQQKAFYQTVVKEALSVRQLEDRVKNWREEKKDPQKSQKPSTPPAASPHSIQLKSLEKQLENKFGSRTQLTQNESSGQGEIRVKFNNKDDLYRILEILEII